MSNEFEDDSGRARRIETRLTRLMMALGIDPGQQYSLADNRVLVDVDNHEVILPNLTVSFLDCANAVSAAGGDLQHNWSLILRDRTLGMLSLAR